MVHPNLCQQIFSKLILNIGHKWGKRVIRLVWFDIERDSRFWTFCQQQSPIGMTEKKIQFYDGQNKCPWQKTGIVIEKGDLILNLQRWVIHSQIKIKSVMKM